MKKKVYKKLTLTIAATGLLLPNTVTYAVEQTPNNQHAPVSEQTETTTQSDGLNNQSAPAEETLTQNPSTENDSSNETTSSSVQSDQPKDTATQKDDQTTTQSNNTTTNEETNTTQEDTSQNTPEPKPNTQPEDSSTGAEGSDNPNDSGNNTETEPTNPDETNPDETNPDEPKPEDTNPDEKPPADDNTEEPEDNNETDKGQGGGTIPQRGEGGSHPVEPTPEEPEPEQPSVPEAPVTPAVPETPEPSSSNNNVPSNNKSGQNSYPSNQQATPASNYHPSADYIPNSSNLASATPSLNSGANEQQTTEDVMPFSNLGLSSDCFGHLITGSFKYNPFIVHQVGMISNDTHSTEDDVHAVLQPQNFSNNSNLNNLQQSTGYFKYQYFSPMRAQQYYANLDLQILGLVTSDLGSMPDLKEVKRDKKAEAKQTTKPSEDTKHNADKAKKKHEEKTTDNQKYPRLLNTLMIVFGAAFIWFIILMIMKRKKQ